MTSQSVQLASDQLEARVLPQRGGVLVDLKIQNQKLLASTDWADDISPYTSYASNENLWVERWMGGWQLCAPNTGSGGLQSAAPAFHGSASQDIWSVLNQTNTSVELVWESLDKQIQIMRRWVVTNQAEVKAETSLVNQSDQVIPIGVAEHLILGSDFLRPLTQDAVGYLQHCPSAEIIELDYSGAPIGQVPEAEKFDLRWSELSVDRPATVFALSNPTRKNISVLVGDWVANIEWEGLDHALIWEEFGYSKDAPWNGQIYALGIEPTNIAHGLGASLNQGPLLEAGKTMTWQTSLKFTKQEGN